jgi:hypothetical protein
MISARLSSIVFVAFTVLGVASLPFAHEVARIDASSNAAAQKSFERMNMQLSKKRQQDLAVAVVEINTIGVNSANEVIDNPELQNMGIQRIKERVSGMTADEIIKYANANATVKLHIDQP